MTKSCWVVLLISIVLFAFMGVLGGPASGLDRAIILCARGLVDIFPPLQPIAVALTHLGSGPVLITLALVAACWLGWKSRWRDAGVLLLITIGGRLMIEGMKLAVGRPRPELDPYPVYISSLSFPSGHAGNSMLTFLALAVIVPPTLRPRLVILAAFASIAIGLTRPILGVHWPSDIIGGWSFGIAWTIACVAMFRRDQTAA